MKHYYYFIDDFEEYIDEISKGLVKLRSIESEMTDVNYEKMFKKFIKQLCVIATIIETFALFARRIYSINDLGPAADKYIRRSEVVTNAIPHRIGFTENNWFFLEIPPVPLYRSLAIDKECFRDSLLNIMREFMETNSTEIISSGKSIVIIRHIYDRNDRRSQPFVINKDHGLIIRNLDPFLKFNLSPTGTGIMVMGDYRDRCCCQIFVVPEAEFSKFLSIVDENGLDGLADNITPEKNG